MVPPRTSHWTYHVTSPQFAFVNCQGCGQGLRDLETSAPVSKVRDRFCKSSPSYSYLSSLHPATHQLYVGIQVAQKPVRTNQSQCTELNTLCLTVCFSCFHSRCLSRQKAGNICSLLLAGRMHTGGKSAEQKGVISPYICVRDKKKTSQGKQ